MKRPWKLWMLASFLFVSFGNTPVLAENTGNATHETMLVNAIKGKAIQVKDKRIFQEKFLKTSERYASHVKKSTILPDEPHVFYCSGFIQELYRTNGIWLPAHSIAQQTSFGYKVHDIKKLEPGDLIFFAGTSKSKLPAHVGVALGNGRFLHASGPDHGVTVIRINDQLQKQFLYATRLVTSV